MQMHEHRHSISIKMAAPLETCSREEQCCVIRFLSSEGVKPTEIHGRMKVHTVMHVCHSSKSTNGVGSSQMV